MEVKPGFRDPQKVKKKKERVDYITGSRGKRLFFFFASIKIFS